MSCPRCGAETLVSQGFCTKCGAALGTTESAQNTGAPDSGGMGSVMAPPPPAPPAAAAIRPIPEGGLTIEEMAAWLENEGYQVKYVTGESGKRHIETSSQGFPLNIFFGDCTGERCASLELATGFSTHGKFDVSQINGWNYDNRWCRAHFDSDKDPWLRMNIDLWPGGTYEALSGRFEKWNSTLGRFIDRYSLG